MSLTDEIYYELCDGLEKGLDWTQFLAKHSSSKGPLYTAIERFFNEVGAKIAALKKEEISVQSQIEQSGLTLDSLHQQIKEGQATTASLKERQDILNNQVAALEAKIAEKSELLKQVGEMEKLGFNLGMLKQLKEVLTEIGAKRGLKGKEAVNKFFEELKDYDTKIGFEQEIHRLGTIISTKKLETEKWQAEAESASRHYKDLNETIAVLQSLIKQGVKPEEIVSWNRIVSKLGGPSELEDKLEQYKSILELLNAKRSEADGYDKKHRQLSAQVKALNEQKVEIEGVIKSLSASGVKKITEVSDKAVASLNALFSSGLKELTGVSDKTIAEIKSLLAETNVQTHNLAEVSVKAGAMEKELMYARYFITGDEAVLKSLPKEVVIVFLERALTYCKLNQLNPLVRVPDGISRKYSIIYSNTDIRLVDLIIWAETGLAGESQ